METLNSRKDMTENSTLDNQEIEERNEILDAELADLSKTHEKIGEKAIALSVASSAEKATTPTPEQADISSEGQKQLDKPKETKDASTKEAYKQYATLARIENIIKNGNLLDIYPLLPDKEAKKYFLENLLRNYAEHIGERLDIRTEEEFEPSDIDIAEQYKKENAKNLRSITGILRSRKRRPIREGVNERVSELVETVRNGGFITDEDREFVAHHLSTGPRFGGFGGDSRAWRRNEVRETLNDYSKANFNALRNEARHKLSLTEHPSYAEEYGLTPKERQLNKLDTRIRKIRSEIIEIQEKGYRRDGSIIEHNTEPYILKLNNRLKALQLMRQQMVEEITTEYTPKSTYKPAKPNFPSPEIDTNKNDVELTDLVDYLDEELKAQTA